MTLRVTPEGETGLVLVRRVAALPEAVFAAHTEPALVAAWLPGPPGWRMTVCEIDLKRGGAGFRYRWEGAGETEVHEVRGSYRAVRRPDRLVHVETATGLPGETRVETLFERDGIAATRLVSRTTYPDAEMRRLVTAAGMETVLAEAYDRLDALLAD